MSSPTPRPLSTSTRAFFNGTATSSSTATTPRIYRDMRDKGGDNKIGMIAGLAFLLPLLVILAAWLIYMRVLSKLRKAHDAAVSQTAHRSSIQHISPYQSQSGPILLHTLPSDNPYAPEPAPNDDAADSVRSNDLAPPPYSKQPNPPEYTCPSAFRSANATPVP